MTEAQVALSDTHQSPGSRRRITPPRSPRRAVFTAWQRHRDLLSNASTLAATTGVTSVLGFTYWAIAARLFSQEAVGYGAAAISAMTLLGTVGMLGMGTLLIGELPRRTARAGLVMAALLTCGLASLVIGLGFAVLGPRFNAHFGHVSGTMDQVAMFAVGVALTGISLVFDQATIGLMRGGLQLTRNAVFAVAKLLAMLATAIILHDRFGVGIQRLWVVGIALSMSCRSPAPARWCLRASSARLGRSARSWQDRAGPQLAESCHHRADDIDTRAGNGGRVTFGQCCLLRGLDTQWFFEGHTDPPIDGSVRGSSSRSSGNRAEATLHVAAIDLNRIAGHGRPWVRSSLRAKYVRSQLRPRGHVATLSAGHRLPPYYPEDAVHSSLPRCRSDTTGSGSHDGAAVMEVIAAAVGGADGGLKGLSFALLGVYLIEGLVTAPPVIRAAMGRGRHRHAVPVAGHTDNLGESLEPCDKPPSQDGSLQRAQEQPWCANSAFAAAPGTVHEGGTSRVGLRLIPETGNTPEESDQGKQNLQYEGLATLISIARCQAPS